MPQTKPKKKQPAKVKKGLGRVSSSKGEISASAPKGPNESLMPPITIELTEEDRKILIRCVERIPREARSDFEVRFLKRVRQNRSKELTLNGAERFMVIHYISGFTMRTRTEAEQALRSKVIS